MRRVKKVVNKSREKKTFLRPREKLMVHRREWKEIGK